jgi:hypothetical protein
MEQGKRTKSGGARAKAMGMTAGVPDLLFWFQEGRIKPIELKTANGTLNAAQKLFHPIIKALGFQVDVVYAKSPMDGWIQVKQLLEEFDGRRAI